MSMASAEEVRFRYDSELIGEQKMTFQEFINATVADYKGRTQASQAAYGQARDVIGGGETRSVSYVNPYPLAIDTGSGAYIRDLDTNEYIDFISNYTSLIHGHANPAILSAIQAALTKVTAVPAGIAEQAELAGMLCARVPSVDNVRFCNSGTEATMFAVRAARAYTGKDGVIKMLGGYHGTTDIFEYSVSPSLKQCEVSSFAPIPESAGISVNAGKDLFVAPFNDPDSVEAILREHSNQISCIITEPFLGAGGVIPAKPGYLKALRDLADRYNVLLIVDEVQGLRLSEGGAQKKYGVNADLSAFGKVIGGGLPVGAFGGREDIMAVFDPRKDGHLAQSGTFNGNRITMAAGVASLCLLDQQSIDRIDSYGEKLQEGMRKIIEKHHAPMVTTREGSLLNIHFLEEEPFDYVSSISDIDAFMYPFYLMMLNAGIFCAPRGLFVVSTVMTQKEIDKALDAFDDAVAAMSPYF
jgi:glutamate-1-semialdehyde 2,1-aminomutase